jgi:hypothetical protein
MICISYMLRTPICGLSLPWQDDVGTSSDAQLVDGIAPVPDATSSFYNSNELLGNALGQATLSTPHVSPLGSSAHDPLHGCSPPLPLTKWYGNLKRHTTTSCTSLASNSHQRGDRVNRKCEV